MVSNETTEPLQNSSMRATKDLATSLTILLSLLRRDPSLVPRGSCFPGTHHPISKADDTFYRRCTKAFSVQIVPKPTGIEESQ